MKGTNSALEQKGQCVPLTSNGEDAEYCSHRMDAAFRENDGIATLRDVLVSTREHQLESGTRTNWRKGQENLQQKMQTYTVLGGCTRLTKKSPTHRSISTSVSKYAKARTTKLAWPQRLLRFVLWRSPRKWRGRRSQTMVSWNPRRISRIFGDGIHPRRNVCFDASSTVCPIPTALNLASREKDFLHGRGAFADEKRGTLCLIGS